MISRRPDEIDFEYLKSLVEAKVREARTIEYKRELNISKDEDKKEFLADVSSLANAGGGYLFLGIAEEDGIPAELIGLQDYNDNRDTLKLHNMIQDGIEPRIQGISIGAIAGGSKGPIVLVWVPRSWHSPHMVTYKGTSRFYSRNSKGKYQLDVTEIRTAFQIGADIPAKISRWRDSRLGRIVANEGPVWLTPGATLVLHLVPLESLDNEWRLSATELRITDKALIPIYCEGWNDRMNLDGYVTFDRDGDKSQPSRRYAQLFRSGRIEAVVSDLISNRSGATSSIASTWFEYQILKSAGHYLDWQKFLGLGTPIAVLVSIMGVKGAYLAVDTELCDDGHPIDRDVLLLLDVIVEHYDDDLDTVFRPVFDAVWNACGFKKCMHYDDAGKWKKPRGIS